MSRMPAAQVHDQGLMLGANTEPDPDVRCRAVRMVATRALSIYVSRTGRSVRVFRDGKEVSGE